MGLINTALSNLLGGVSQQADSLRGASNCEEQINAYPSPVEGLVKRPATQFMGIVGNYEPETSHLIERDAGERYIVSVTSRTNSAASDYGQLKVWDIVNNVEKLVYYDTDAVSYLVAEDLINNFKFTTAGDVTYITNTEVIPEMETTVSEEAVLQGIVHVRQGAYKVNYQVKLNGQTSQETTANTGDSEARTDTIASKLHTQLNGGGVPNSVSDGTVTLGDSGDALADGTDTFFYNTRQYKAIRWRLSPSVASVLAAVTGLTLINKTVEITDGGSSGSLLVGYYEGFYSAPDTEYVQTGDLFYVAKHAADFTWIELKVLVNGGTSNILSRYNDFYSGSGTATIKINYTSSADHPNFTIIRKGSTLLLTNTADETFTLSTTDSVGDTYIKSFFKDTQYFSDLPAYCYNGFSVKVSGSPESDVDDYYVKFVTNDGSSFGEGSWVERVGFNVLIRPKASTMPHLLIRQADGTFLFKPADGTSTPANVTAGYTAPTAEAYDSFVWEDRKSGDEATNPVPNFIGNKINDVFFYENRLGILSGESVTLSESGQFFNFFRTTVIDLLDTAPIEVVGSSNSVNILRHAVPFNGNLILFGDKTQFMLGSGREGLSPKNVAMSQASNYECDPDCKPIISGNSVFFGFDRGDYGGAREMVIRDPEARDLTAFDLTAHIPSYISKAFQSIVSMPQENLIICMPKLDHRYPNEEMRTLYFYKYLDRGNERVQSAWFKYELEIDYDATHWAIIKNIHVSGNALYIHQGYIKRDAAGSGTSQTITESDSTYWKMEFTDGAVTDLHKTPPLLDNCIPYLGTGIAATILTGALDGSDYDASTLVVTVVGLVDDTVIPEGATFTLPDPLGGSPNVDTTVTVGGTVVGGSVTLNVAQMGITSAADVVEIGIMGTDNVTAVWDGSKTTFTLPMNGLIKDITKYKCITKYQEGVTDGGTELTITHNAGTATTWTIDIAGPTSYVGTHLWFGKTFDMTYKYANPIFKGPSSGGGASLVTSGRYQVHSADIVYNDTNTFNVAVSVEGRSDYSYVFTADTTQVDVDAEGVVGLDSGDMRIPIHAKNDTYDMTITSSSPYPVKLLSTEFESQYNTRSRRMGI